MKRKKREKTIPEQFIERYGYQKPFEHVLNMSFERVKDIVCGVMDDKEDVAYAMIAFWHAAYDWNRYKQIYRFSDELYNDIKNMEDEKIPSEVLQLPFPCIYVDLSGQSKIFRGAMIDLQERQLKINGPKKKYLIIGFIRDEPDRSD